MTTISVPFPPHLEEFISQQIKLGKATNKAQVIRYAVTRLSEQEAINAVLEAQKEPTLRGNLRDLAKKI